MLPVCRITARALFHKVRKSSAHRLRELKEPVRRAVLACFL